MSRENVEVVRRGLDAYNRRDWAAWLDLADPDFEVVPSALWPESDPIRGREAAWDFYLEVDESWEASASEAVEISDVGQGRVLVHLRRDARGKTSGAEVTLEYWVVTTVRDEKAWRVEWFADQAQALEAVGLRE